MILLLTRKQKKVFKLSSEIAEINRSIRVLSEEILTAEMNNNKFNVMRAKFDQRELTEERDELIEILKKL